MIKDDEVLDSKIDWAEAFSDDFLITLMELIETASPMNKLLASEALRTLLFAH